MENEDPKSNLMHMTYSLSISVNLFTGQIMKSNDTLNKLLILAVPHQNSFICVEIGRKTNEYYYNYF